MSQTETEYKPSPLVDEFLREEKATKAEQTYKNRKSDMKIYEGWCEDNNVDVVQAKPRDIQPFFFCLDDEGYSASAIRSKYSSLTLFYRFLDEWLDEIEESPFKTITREKYRRFMSGTEKERQTRDEITYVTPEQAELLAENVGEPRLRNELLVKLAYQTGMREGELAGVRLEDVNREEREIKILAEKTGKHRAVYYQPSLDMLLKQWIDGGYRDSFSYAPDSPYLFVSDQSSKLNKERVNQIVVDAAENAGIQETMYVDKAGKKRHKITSHALRHGHAVEWVKCGGDIKTLALHLGHTDKYGNANIKMTQKYLRFTSDDVKNAAKNFGTRRATS